MTEASSPVDAVEASSSPIDERVPILVVGAGPVGVTLANLLGSYGVGALVVDRSPTVHDFPRAVGIDDESLRTFQAAGLADTLLRDIIQNVPMRMYGARKECFAEILPSTREFGWFRRNIFSQPLAERVLRHGLERFPCVELRTQTELMALSQDDSGVTATLRLSDGRTRTVRSEFLVACDGGRSAVREGMLKVAFEGKTHAHKWVVLECEDDPLDAPYTALHCEPQRPYVCLRLPYGLRRWEFMLFPGEDGEQMLAPEKVHGLLRSHVSDPTALKIIRARVYTHNSRVARSFVVGRVCLAGDAAHITPPWIGQGLNAGLRDAFNLAWKLAWIVRGRMDANLLQSYHEERHAHAKAMVDLADLFGAVLSQRNRFVAWMRDRCFMSIRHWPALRDYVLQMKFKPMPSFTKGVVFAGPTPAASVGQMFIQPSVEHCGETKRLDDVLGPRFALISWRGDPVGPDSSGELSQLLNALDCTRVVGVRSRGGPSECLAFAQAAGSLLVEDCDNQLQRWFQTHRVDWVLIRPDRYVAAAGCNPGATEAITQAVSAILPPSPAPARSYGQGTVNS